MLIFFNYTLRVSQVTKSLIILQPLCYFNNNFNNSEKLKNNAKQIAGHYRKNIPGRC